MKTILSFLCLLIASTVFSQTQLKNRDTTEQKNALSVSELFVIGKKTYQEDYTPFKGHSRGFHVGFMNFAHLPEMYDGMKLKGSGSFTFQFNIFNHNIGLNKRNNIGLITGLGLEYQRFRLDNSDYTLAKIDGATSLVNAKERYSDIESVKRSSFKNLYLTIPLMLEVQFPASKYASKRFYVSGGFMGGVRMHSKTKVVYHNTNHKIEKQKQKGNFNVVPFKVDAIARIGYSKISIWGGYTITNLFKDKNLTDLNVYTIGFGLNI